MDSKSLEKKLSSLKDTTEDIQALSRWCIQHRTHHHSIVRAWSRAVRKAKVPHRLTLFYVCNDVVQNAKRKKCIDLVKYFGTAIKEAAPLVRDEKIQKKIIRIFNIWEERGIYDNNLVTELTSIVEKVGTVDSSEKDLVISTFQLAQLVESIRTLVALGKTSETCLEDLKASDHFMSEDAIKKIHLSLKERSSSNEKLDEFSNSVASLECYITSVQTEIDERTKVVTQLEDAEIFYETQRGEAKLVATAYKKFSSHLKNLKGKIKDKIRLLPEAKDSSPSDAPSPEDSDMDDDVQVIPDMKINLGMGSFMDSNTPLGAFTEVSEIFSRSSESSETSNTKKSSRDHEKNNRRRSRSSSRDKLDLKSPRSYLNSSSYKDTKPMNAKELLDTFGGSYSSKQVSMPPSAPPVPVVPYPHPPAPPIALPPLPCPLPNLPPLPVPAPYSKPPPLSGSLSIPLPPSKPLSVPPPGYAENFPPPLPSSSPKLSQPPPYPPREQSVNGSQSSVAQWPENTNIWIPPPPPPPLPTSTQKRPPHNNTWRHESASNYEWSSYDNNQCEDDEPPDDDDDCDGRNWGEPPGIEELQTYNALKAAAAAGTEDSFMAPPPPPPQSVAFPPYEKQRHGSGQSDDHSNLVNIKRSSASRSAKDKNPCYDYSKLAQDNSFRDADLFSSDDTDMRCKKKGVPQNNDSGSDMDISDSEISDDENRRSGKARSRKSVAGSVDSSSHKPVSFSVAKGNRVTAPDTSRDTGFQTAEQEEQEVRNKRKNSMPNLPNKLAKTSAQLGESRGNANNESIADDNLSFLDNPLLGSLDAAAISQALHHVRTNTAKMDANQEFVSDHDDQSRSSVVSDAPSLSEALGLYVDKIRDTEENSSQSKDSMDLNKSFPISTTNTHVIQSFVSDARPKNANNFGDYDEQDHYWEDAKTSNQVIDEPSEEIWYEERSRSSRANQRQADEYHAERGRGFAGDRGFNNHSPCRGGSRGNYANMRDSIEERPFPSGTPRGLHPRGRGSYGSPQGQRWSSRGRTAWW